MSFIDSLPQRGAGKKGKGCFKPKGRPFGWRKHKAGEPIQYTTIRLRTDRKNYLESIRTPDENIDQVITRILQERADSIKEIREENDRLKAEIDRLRGLLNLQTLEQENKILISDDTNLMEGN